MEGTTSPVLNNNNTDSDSVFDRISDLPDEILGHILSFIPTDMAVATSILSKRWKFAWVTIDSLYLYDSGPDIDVEGKSEEEIVEFVRFVNRVLLLNGNGSLNNFSLHCCPMSFSPQIISWTDTAITRNVRRLSLSLGDIDVPQSIFICHSLRSLELYGFIPIYDSYVFCLPRLESLKIDLVLFQSPEVCEKLISGCPMLDSLNLHIQDYDDDGVDEITYIISSSSLRHLEINFEDDCILRLKTPSLEHLSLSGSISEIFVEKSLSTLIQADIKFSFCKYDFSNNCVEAVRALHCVKFLTLSSCVMHALKRATISLSTKFKRLVKLDAGAYCRVVQDFVHNSENLEEVVIYKEYRGTKDSHEIWCWTVPLEDLRKSKGSI